VLVNVAERGEASGPDAVVRRRATCGRGRRGCGTWPALMSGSIHQGSVLQCLHEAAVAFQIRSLKFHGEHLSAVSDIAILQKYVFLCAVTLSDS
jgi:hypothetical protein